jgi:hypothetical protein
VRLVELLLPPALRLVPELVPEQEQALVQERRPELERRRPVQRQRR